MKHFKIVLLFAALFISSSALHAQWTDKLTLYLPNRIMDVMDTFTINLGGGPTLHGELFVTRACEVGGGLNYTFQLIKDHNRQYGWAAQNGYAAYFPFFAKEDLERRPASYFVKEYWQTAQGVPSPKDPIYDSRNGARDFWEFGTALGLGVIDLKVSVHPVELLDAVLGFFFIDIRNDDMTFENFR